MLLTVKYLLYGKVLCFGVFRSDKVINAPGSGDFQLTQIVTFDPASSYRRLV